MYNSSFMVIVRYSAIRRSCSPSVPVGTDRAVGELGDQYLGALPHDPRAVSLLLRAGSPSHRALRRLDLIRALNSRLVEVLAHSDKIQVTA
jgi:hypothetical protein